MKFPTGVPHAASQWDCNTQQPCVRKFCGSEQLLPVGIRSKEVRRRRITNPKRQRERLLQLATMEIS
ncbi:MAG: hypothetical protein DWI21_14520 [Planctomycetota bacterium]|nr:MAG: hypothetical protein DWI21_14520 [Planctomycetota bacterium]